MGARYTDSRVSERSASTRQPTLVLPGGTKEAMREAILARRRPAASPAAEPPGTPPNAVEPPGPARPPAEKALRGPAVRALLAMLTSPTLLGGTARDLAIAAGGVSPQTANDLRHRLVARGDLFPSRRGGVWAPGGFERALELLVHAFPAMCGGLLIGRYRARSRDPGEVEALLASALPAVGAWRWGGAAGAFRLTGYYRTDQVLVYLEQHQPQALGGLPVVPDAAGPITLRRSPGPAAFRGPTDEVVHPVLLYADLLAEGHARAQEAADELYRQFLLQRDEPA